METRNQEARAKLGFFVGGERGVFDFNPLARLPPTGRHAIKLSSVLPNAAADLIE